MKPTQEQVIASAREVELFATTSILMKFATLAYEAGRTAEREKVAAWMIQRSYATGHGDTTEDLLAELDWQIAENWNRAMINGIETERESAKLDSIHTCHDQCQRPPCVAVREAYAAGRKDENEACVKVCKDLRQKISNEAKGVTVAGQLMAAIRARMAPLQRLNKAAEDNGEEL